MASNDIFAPPTKAELKVADSDVFAPPTKAEMGDDRPELLPVPNAPPAPVDSPPQKSAIEALGASAVNSAIPIVGLPEVYGAVRSSPRLFGSDSAPSYNDARNDAVDYLQGLKKDQPLAFNAGRAGGTLIPAGLAGSAIAKVISSVGGWAALAEKFPSLYEALKAGVGAGATENPASMVKNAELSDYADPVGRAKTAAAVGAFAGGANMLGTVGADAAASGAEERAFRSLGPSRRDAKLNQGRAQDVGRTLLDEGAVGWIPKSKQGLADAADSLADKVGSEMDPILAKIESNPDLPGVQKDELIRQVKALSEKDPILPENRRINQQIGEMGDELGQALPDEVSVGDLRRIKRAAGDNVNWKRLPGTDAPLSEEFNKTLYSRSRQAEDELLDSISKSGDVPEAAGFGDLKRRYGDLSEAGDIASNRAAGDLANKTIGLTDTISGAGGASVGAAIGGAGAGHIGAKAGAAIGGAAGTLGNKFLRTYGNQISAKGLDSMSDLLGNLPKLQQYVRANPLAGSDLMDRIKERQENSTPKQQLQPIQLGQQQYSQSN